MSIERCEKHNWQWDSDFVGACPQCDWGDTEPAAQAGSPTRPDGQVGSTIDPSFYDAHGCAYKEPAAEQETDAQTPRTDALESLGYHDTKVFDLARSLEREAADLRRQLDEAQDFVTAADEQVHFHGMAKERAEIRAETAEAALAAFKQEYADMKLALAAERAAKEAAQNSDEHNFNRWQQAERERDAALAQAAAVQEERAKVCDQMMPLADAAHLKLQRETLENTARLIRSLTIAPEAGRNVAEDAARFVYYCKVLYDYSLQAGWPDSFRDAETIDQLRAAIDAARKGEEW